MSTEREGGDKKGTRGPQPSGAEPGGPLPSPASAEEPVRPLPRDSAGGPGRGAGAEVGTEESRRGGELPAMPGGQARAGARDASASGGPGAGVAGSPGSGGRAAGGRPLTHLPARTAARARGQRGAAPGVHVVGDAQHPQEGEAEQHPRAPPHSPHSAAGRGAAASECCLGPAGRRAGGPAGRAGAERRKGKGAARLRLRRALPLGEAAGAARAGRRAPPRAGTAARSPSRKPRLRRRPGGQGAKGDQSAGGSGRARAEEKGLARLQGCSTPAAPPPLRPPARPSAPLSDRWLPGPRGSARTRALTHVHQRGGSSVTAASCLLPCKDYRLVLPNHVRPLKGSFLLAHLPEFFAATHSWTRPRYCSLQFAY